MTKIFSESLNHGFESPDHPQRVISLVSSATEALFVMGCGERVIGVSSYCARYVPDLSKPVAGDYLSIDEARFEALDPDLVLVTTGVQRDLGLKLVAKDLPVYALPLPNSFYGIMENNRILAALMNEMQKGHQLCSRMDAEAARIRGCNSKIRPRVYVELWFGRHTRTIGGRTFIHALVTIAGGEPIFADRCQGYLKPDFNEVEAEKPDVLVFFSEPEYPIDPEKLLEERGWSDSLDAKIITSSVKRGRNFIHDGPSFLETAAWLQEQLNEPIRKP